jgi:hypothetical protein
MAVLVYLAYDYIVLFPILLLRLCVDKVTSPVANSKMQVGDFTPLA